MILSTLLNIAMPPVYLLRPNFKDRTASSAAFLFWLITLAALPTIYIFLLNTPIPWFLWLIDWGLASYASITAQFWVATWQLDEKVIDRDQAGSWLKNWFNRISIVLLPLLGLLSSSAALVVYTLGIISLPFTWPVLITLAITSVTVPTLLLFAIHNARYCAEKLTFVMWLKTYYGVLNGAWFYYYHSKLVSKAKQSEGSSEFSVANNSIDQIEGHPDAEWYINGELVENGFPNNKMPTDPGKQCEDGDTAMQCNSSSAVIMQGLSTSRFSLRTQSCPVAIISNSTTTSMQNSNNIDRGLFSPNGKLHTVPEEDDEETPKNDEELGFFTVDLQ